MQNHDDQNEVVYAGFFVRLAAYLLDALLVGSALLILRIPMWVISMMSPNNIIVKPILFVFAPCDLILYFLSVFYFIMMTYNAGATIGKRLLNLKVIASDEQKLTLITVIYRETIGKYLSSVIMSIGYILVGVDKEKRGLHDILCDTRVIYSCKMRLVYPTVNMYGNYGVPSNPMYQPIPSQEKPEPEGSDKLENPNNQV